MTRQTGDRYRPIVTILKTTTTKAGKTYPTVIEVSGRVYQYRLTGHTKRKRSRRRCQTLLKKEQQSKRV